jgi:hypothetical protein
VLAIGFESEWVITGLHLLVGWLWVAFNVAGGGSGLGNLLLTIGHGILSGVLALAACNAYVFEH